MTTTRKDTRLMGHMAGRRTFRSLEGAPSRPFYREPWALSFRNS